MKPIDMRGNDPGGNSPFPWHHMPNVAPDTYYLIDSSYRLMKGDLYWAMETGLWAPIDKADIGEVDTLYYRLARPIVNSQVAIARRSKSIKWQSMETADMHCTPMILRLKSGRIVMGRTLSIAPDYRRQGWFEDVMEPDGGYEYHTTHRRLYPVAWAALPNDLTR